MNQGPYNNRPRYHGPRMKHGGGLGGGPYRNYNINNNNKHFRRNTWIQNQPRFPPPPFLCPPRPFNFVCDYGYTPYTANPYFEATMRRPPSPQPGSDEYTQRSIQQTSEILKRGLDEGPDNEIILPTAGSSQTQVELTVDDFNNSKHNDKQKPKAAKSTIQTMSAKEILKKIQERLVKLSQKKMFDVVNQESETYNMAIEKLHRQHRAAISRELRDMLYKRVSLQNCEVINAIIPDIAIKLEDLPEKVIAELSQNLNLDLEPMIDPEMCFKQAEDMLCSNNDLNIDHSESSKPHMPVNVNHSDFHYKHQPNAISSRHDFQNHSMEDTFKCEEMSASIFTHSDHSDSMDSHGIYPRVKVHVRAGRCDSREGSVAGGSQKIKLKRDRNAVTSLPFPPPAPKLSPNSMEVCSSVPRDLRNITVIKDEIEENTFASKQKELNDKNRSHVRTHFKDNKSHDDYYRHHRSRRSLDDGRDRNSKYKSRQSRDSDKFGIKDDYISDDDEWNRKRRRSRSRERNQKEKYYYDRNRSYESREKSHNESKKPIEIPKINSYKHKLCSNSPYDPFENAKIDHDHFDKPKSPQPIDDLEEDDDDDFPEAVFEKIIDDVEDSSDERRSPDEQKPFPLLLPFIDDTNEELDFEQAISVSSRDADTTEDRNFEQVDIPEYESECIVEDQETNDSNIADVQVEEHANLDTEESNDYHPIVIIPVNKASGEPLIDRLQAKTEPEIVKLPEIKVISKVEEFVNMDNDTKEKFNDVTDFVDHEIDHGKEEVLEKQIAPIDTLQSDTESIAKLSEIKDFSSVEEVDAEQEQKLDDVINVADQNDAIAHATATLPSNSELQLAKSKVKAEGTSIIVLESTNTAGTYKTVRSLFINNTSANEHLYCKQSNESLKHTEIESNSSPKRASKRKGDGPPKKSSKKSRSKSKSPIQPKISEERKLKQKFPYKSNEKLDEVQTDSDADVDLNDINVLRERYYRFKRKTRSMLKKMNDIDQKLMDLLNERREIQKSLDIWISSSDDSEQEISIAEAYARQKLSESLKVVKPETNADEETPAVPETEAETPKKTETRHKPVQYIIISDSSKMNPVLNSDPPSSVLTQVFNDEINLDSPPDFNLPHDFMPTQEIFLSEAEHNNSVLSTDLFGFMDNENDTSLKLLNSRYPVVNVTNDDLEKLRHEYLKYKTSDDDITPTDLNNTETESDIVDDAITSTNLNNTETESDIVDDAITSTNLNNTGTESEVVMEQIVDGFMETTPEPNAAINFIGWKDSILVVQVIDNIVIAGNDKGKLYYYDLTSGHIIFSVTQTLSSKAITSISIWKGKSVWLFIGSLDGNLYIVDFHARKNVKIVAASTPIQCLDISWGIVFLGSTNGDLMHYSIKDEKLSAPIKISEHSVLVIKANQEGPRNVLLVATRNSPVTIRDPITGLLLRRIGGALNPTIYALHFYNNRVYCGTSQHDVLVYNFQDGQLVFKHQESKGSGVICLARLKHILFVACYNGNIYVYNMTDNSFITSIPGPRGLFLCMDVTESQIIIGTKLHFQCTPLPSSVLDSL